MVPMSSMPGFWRFMYRVSPFTYFVEGMIGTAVANTNVVCAANEFLPIIPPRNLTCSEYMGPYITAAGGYLKDPTATDLCEFCQLSSTNMFLAAVGIKYDHRWRNWGLLWAYVAFNVFGALLLYWLCRVPHKQHEKISALAMRRKKSHALAKSASRKSGDRALARGGVASPTRSKELKSVPSRRTAVALSEKALARSSGPSEGSGSDIQQWAEGVTAAKPDKPERPATPPVVMNIVK